MHGQEHKHYPKIHYHWINVILRKTKELEGEDCLVLLKGHANERSCDMLVIR